MVEKTVDEVKFNHILDFLQKKNYIPMDCSFQSETYHRYREFLLQNIHVPDTTITPVMEKFLFSIGSSKFIKNIVVLGSYYGYAMFWLLGGGLTIQDRHVYGIDIDEVACEGAANNLSEIIRKYNLNQYSSIYHMDALRSPEKFKDNSIDLLFLDIDVNGSKKEYKDLLEMWKTKMKEGCIVLAHDPVVPKFEYDFKLFHNYISENLDSYHPYITLPIDFCGIDIFKNKRGDT